jgi:hypothetical protein
VIVADGGNVSALAATATSTTRDHSCSGEAPPGFGSTKGDVIEFRLASLGHGVVTLDKPGSDHLVGICLSEF